MLAGRASRSHLVPGLEVVKTDLPIEEAIAQLRSQRAVQSVEPDCLVRLADTPDDPGFDQTWGLQNTGQTGGTPGADIRAVGAWGIRTDASSVTVAVIDTGMQPNHPDLAANLWTNADEIPTNGIDDDANGFIDDVHGWDFVNGAPISGDDNGHGTHVAGTIGAVGNNGVGIAGVAWSVRLMPLKAFNAGGVANFSAVLAALDYAVANDARIVNASYGANDFVKSEYDAYVAVGAAGVLTLAAAGNNAKNADESPHYPASFRLDTIISVAATTADDTLASFSNYGVWNVQVAAPGSAIYSTLPGSSYGLLSGTSMATPHVTGVAALLAAAHPGWSAVQIRDRILGTTRSVPALAGKALTGGVVNAATALSQCAERAAGTPRSLTRPDRCFRGRRPQSGPGGRTGPAGIPGTAGPRFQSCRRRCPEHRPRRVRRPRTSPTPSASTASTCCTARDSRGRTTS